VGRLKRLHQVGQSIWLDNITRELLRSGTLARYIDDLSVTGLTSNPTIFERAIAGSRDYDDSIKALLGGDLDPEALFFDLAIEDLSAAADLFAGVHRDAEGHDGFVSLEVSPRLAHDAAATITAAKRLHAQAARPNLMIKVPGTPEGAEAIEELTFAGVPVNVTLLFSTGQWAAAAEAFTRGIERRIADDLDPGVASVASLFVSRWDAAASPELPTELVDRTGIAVAHCTFAAARRFFDSERWRRLEAAGARPQRLLWASTGTKNPELPAGYYVTALAAPGTVNTMPEKTLLAFDRDGEVAATLDSDATEAMSTLEAIERSGLDVVALASKLQADGRDSFVADFEKLLSGIASKAAALR
jgi:transaldolase